MKYTSTKIDPWRTRQLMTKITYKRIMTYYQYTYKALLHKALAMRSKSKCLYATHKLAIYFHGTKNMPRAFLIHWNSVLTNTAGRSTQPNNPIYNHAARLLKGFSRVPHALNKRYSIELRRLSYEKYYCR